MLWMHSGCIADDAVDRAKAHPQSKSNGHTTKGARGTLAKQNRRSEISVGEGEKPLTAKVDTGKSKIVLKDSRSSEDLTTEEDIVCLGCGEVVK